MTRKQRDRQNEAKFLRNLHKYANEGVEAPGFDSHDDGEKANDLWAERVFGGK